MGRIFLHSDKSIFNTCMASSQNLSMCLFFSNVETTLRPKYHILDGACHRGCCLMIFFSRGMDGCGNFKNILITLQRKALMKT